MTWTTEIDRELCMGSGMCAGLAPDLFRLDAASRAEPVRTEFGADERALDAADSCPGRPSWSAPAAARGPAPLTPPFAPQQPQ